MGNNQSCCSVRIRQPSNTLDKKEVFLLCDVLKHSQEGNQSTHLDQQCFERIFQDNPLFGQQVYEYCQFQLKVNPLPLEGCINILQGILSTSDITPICLQICMENYDSQLQIITAQQAFQFIGLITSIFLTFCIRKQQIDASVLETLVNSLFKEKQMKINEFLSIMEANFPHVQKLIRLYLQYRLLQKPFNQMRVAKIDKDSFSLKYEWLAIMGLATSELHRHGQLTLLYQSALQSINFQDILNFMQQTQILFVATFQDEQTNKKQTIAIYNKQQWQLDAKDSDNIIAFQLAPYFYIYRSKSKNYFNTNGFGYSLDSKTNKYLLWIGQQNSYFCNSQRLLTIEIWRCEELQSKLRKSVVIEDERTSTLSPKDQKKRVSFKLMDENQPTRKSSSVTPTTRKANLIENPAISPPPIQPLNTTQSFFLQTTQDGQESPRSPHFKTDNLPTFNNPQGQIIKSYPNPTNITNTQQLTRPSQNRPSQSIIDKYQNGQRQTRSYSNNDIRKSVDDILKRYEKKQ
ncbi:unnamed protein product [Paramecium primaurelia]|uniref:TLDc domain-containing protein n=1 Tax=Paramecium primaurelia TaxID=5886 RepID=A0A8S1KWX8_PARPR|nr:unnamed protein product [Paramecium primaurelia]